MAVELDGSTAFVTGGASGIGRGIARSLANAGAAVAVADIDPDAAQRTCDEITQTGGRALAVACDVTQRESLEQAAQRTTDELGPVQVLVNNAGAFTSAALEDTTEQDWRWLLDINVMGVVNGLHVFLPRMRAHGRPSHVLNTASVSGHIAVPGLSTYTATKFAVMGLSEALRLELADSAIGCSVLCPGVVRTALVETSIRHRDPQHGPARQDASAIGQLIESGSDPDEIGAMAVRAMAEGRFYVFTHPQVRPAFAERFQEILDAYPDD